MNIGDLLGAMMQSGMAPSSGRRMQNALGGGLLEGLGGLIGGGMKRGGSGDMLSGALGGMLGEALNQAGRAAGGKQNPTIDGLGSLVGALSGGGRSFGGSLGGGIMALLGAMAFKAMQRGGHDTGKVPLGLVAPQTESERQELGRHEELVMRAMINAAKADGRIDEQEIHRIVGKLRETGAGAETRHYVQTQLQKPMETGELISAAKGRPELAAQIYAASLMAIEVDTPSEKAYLRELAAGLGLTSEVTGRIAQMVGLTPL